MKTGITILLLYNLIRIKLTEADFGSGSKNIIFTYLLKKRAASRCFRLYAGVPDGNVHIAAQISLTHSLPKIILTACFS